MFMELLNSVFGFISLKKKTYPEMVVSPPENMNLLTESTGLHHLIETIFMNLSYEDLLIKCQQVNVQWRCLVRNPLLWLQKCESLTKEKCVTKMTRNIIEAFYHLHLEDELTPVHYAVTRRFCSKFHSWRMTDIIRKLENSSFKLIKTISTQTQIFK